MVSCVVVVVRPRASIQDEFSIEKMMVRRVYGLRGEMAGVTIGSDNTETLILEDNLLISNCVTWRRVTIVLAFQDATTPRTPNYGVLGQTKERVLQLIAQ
jgi:hypothetical protein